MLRMLRIMSNNERLIKENLLALEICNAMFFPILIDITFIPVEPGEFPRPASYYLRCCAKCSREPPNLDSKLRLNQAAGGDAGNEAG
jgi:hypothetical protein